MHTFRSRQKVHVEIGPLEDSAGNVISHAFLMAEYFSSVFATEEINSLPIPKAKYKKQGVEVCG